MVSNEMRAHVLKLAEAIGRNVSDPNPAVAGTLRAQVFISESGGGRNVRRRAVGQVGVAPWLVAAEAKRGFMARALGATRDL